MKGNLLYTWYISLVVVFAVVCKNRAEGNISLCPLTFCQVHFAMYILLKIFDYNFNFLKKF